MKVYMKSFLRKFTFFYKILKVIKGSQHIILIDYKYRSEPRWGHGKPSHPLLYEIINKNRNEYKEVLKSFLNFNEFFRKIPIKSDSNQSAEWGNTYFKPLDSLVLYSLVALKRPQTYLEIGSGNTTKFVRQAINDHHLNTNIISVDPTPRAEVDDLCDKIVRKQLDKIELELFLELKPGDFLSLDGSHCCFMNSDVTIFFIDILPRLKPNIFVHIHDITLPNDYPIDYHWSEQYLLAAYILAKGNLFDIFFPNYFVRNDNELSSILKDTWLSIGLDPGKIGGVSFWIKTV
tara:strand:+ start:515 stop:1384 length:870 start_codon:yes stop_codon:yes gene_type:complete